MQILVNIPIKADILNKHFEIKVTLKGESWKKLQLGDYADRSGIYIHHSDGKILYVGKTTEGKWGTFGERLRREFQETSSGKSNLFQLLNSQEKPIFTYFLDLDDIDMMVNQGSMTLSHERKALILEQILIGIIQPEGNRI